MDALNLNPRTYGGTYKLIGGRPSLDFINTISWPDTERHHDWFDPPENVVRWAEAVGLDMNLPTAKELQAILELRTIVRNVIWPLAHRQHPLPSDVNAFNAVLSGAASRRRIHPAALKWIWPAATAPSEALDAVLFDAATVVTGDTSRLKHCPSCDWVFEDHTRNGQRRWCDMRDCGSRAKSRDYYYRTKTSARENL